MVMRSYGQACAVAKALDVIGDRWTLLIVRELLIRGACRYTDLMDGLPGIATNLLAERLIELQQAGLVTRVAAPPPVATSLFYLTERGKALEPVLEALGHWGTPLLAAAPGKDAFRSHWIALPIRLYVRDKSPSGKPVRLEIRSNGESLAVETVGDGTVTTRVGSVDAPDATLDGPPKVALAFLMGTLTLASAQRKGLKYVGNRKLAGRFART
jgi:DNA-binding HxlR family transcriptional regulator